MSWQSICEAHCLDASSEFSLRTIIELHSRLEVVPDNNIPFSQVQPQATGRNVWWRLGVGGCRGSGFKRVRAPAAHDEKLRRGPHASVFCRPLCLHHKTHNETYWRACCRSNAQTAWQCRVWQCRACWPQIFEYKFLFKSVRQDNWSRLLLI